MAGLRILVVDDSVVARRVVSEVLSQDAAVAEVHVAASGPIALRKLSRIKPDLVTLDVDMPGMDGLETLARIRKADPVLPVIMLSALTRRGASATLDALSLGATDYVAKPHDARDRSAVVRDIRRELIPRIKAICAGAVPAPVAPVEEPPGGLDEWRRAPRSRRRRGRIDAVVIGVSTGGPNALRCLLPQLPAGLRVPVLVVQHMPALFTDQLAARLDELCPLRVTEAAEGDQVVPGGVWIAPGDHHMKVVAGARGVRVALDRSPPENSCRPAADVLFRSAASVYKRATLALVLTGMGQDGLRGCKAIRNAGGRVIVQNRATSVVWGMPGLVHDAGLAHRALPLDELAGAVLDEVAFPGERAPGPQPSRGVGPFSGGGDARRAGREVET